MFHLLLLQSRVFFPTTLFNERTFNRISFSRAPHVVLIDSQFIKMDNYADSVRVDLNNVDYSDSFDAECSCDEDVNYVGSSDHKSSNDEDESDNDEEEESI
ncbi:unnamed protein product [Vicia faba]|uniref:Uncharacterized protein n=1 Tax=Vicia faba TaxID=3906 RepID=A0AAV0YV75_VICFA|nr:unnamed protein product [Vicia faba]